MASGDLTSADLDLAFTFARSEAADYRDDTGALVTAAVDAPRFDHDEAGVAKGLLVTSGVDLGGGDRLLLDPLMLPVDLISSGNAALMAATVFHHFDGGTGDGAVRRAWYSRNAQATVNALMLQAGHHLELGVVTGFREAVLEAGVWFVRLRGQVWLLPQLLGAGAGVLAAQPGKPLISCGAEMI